MAVANYRSMFFLYAMHAMNVQHQPEKASRILDRMEEVIPRRSAGMNYKIKYDLASFYTLFKTANEQMNFYTSSWMN